MDSLEKYLSIQRRENEALQQEIITKLEELFQPLNDPTLTVPVNPSRYSNFILELCQFEQKINHKLTEINFELKKFEKQNKRPVYHAPISRSHTCDDALDIDTLKANSTRLICKLDKLRRDHPDDSDIKSFVKTELDNTSRALCEDDMNISVKPNIHLPGSDQDVLCEDIDLISNDVFMKKCNNSVGEMENKFDAKFAEFEGANKVEPSSPSEVLKECKEKFEVSEISSMSETEEEIVVSTNRWAKDESVEPLEKNSTKFEEIVENSNKKESSLVKSESKLSQFIWKNIMELDCSKPKKIQTCVDIQEQICEIPNVEVESEKVEENQSDNKETNPDGGIQEIRSLESEKSSESESDSGVLPDSDTDIDLVKFNPTSNPLNTGDLNRSAVLKESKVEDSKPIFSAEEKIKKLGLDDRWTLFEKSRKVAMLPDLRLKPTLRHNQSKNTANSPLEIADSIVPALNTFCVFSHVESPSEFYLHPNIEEAKLIDSLNDLLTEQNKRVKKPFNSKLKAYENLGNFCCAYVKEDKMYYRAEIVDWLLEKSDKLVLVQLVDFGNYSLVHFKNLRRLSEEVSSLPKLAVRCYFPYIYPPGSTRNNLLTEWPKSSTEALFELGGLSMENNAPMFKIVYVERENGKTAIDLCQANEQETNTIGQLLIDLGHAVQIVLPEDDPMGVLSNEEDIRRLEHCNNLNEVILGYDPKDEARICKYTRPGGGRCFKRTCKLEHVEYTRGGFTTDQTLTYAQALSDLMLPKVGDYIAIRFTTFLEPNRFYANLVCYIEELRHLESIMNDSANYSKFEPFKILPAYGEVVIVKHWQKRWLRARVRHHLFDEDDNCRGVQVFMLDYGDIIDVPLNCIRHIKTEYLNLPFQAIECVLQNYKDSTRFGLKDMDRFFYENMVFRPFNAKVLAISDLQLCLEVYYKDKNLGDILMDYGFLERAERKIVLPHSNSILIPG